jgi:O-antigen/teichoic acid export membrane protein
MVGTAVAVVVLASLGMLTVAAYLILLLLGSALTLAIVFVALRVRPRRGGLLRPLVRFGTRAYVGTLASVANFQLDQAIIAPFLGTRDLGHYAIAVTISNLPVGLAAAIGSRVYGAVGLDETGTIDHERAGRVLRLAVTGSLIFCAGLGLSAPVLIPLLYGADFKASILPLLLLLPGTIAVSAGAVAEAALVLAGRPGVTSRAEAVALVITVAGLGATVPTLGIAGAAATTSVSYIARFAVQLRGLRKSGEFSWLPKVEEFRRILGEIVKLTSRLGRTRGEAPG